MKKALCLLLAAVMMLMSVGIAAEENLAATLNGKEISMNGEAVLKDGSVFLPMRAVAESCGFAVEWQEDSKTAVVSSDSVKVYIPIGEKEIKKDEMSVTVKDAAFIQGGNTYVSAEILSAMGINAEYDKENNSLALTVDYLVNKYFKFVQASTGKVLTVGGREMGDGKLLAMEEADGSDIQIWQFAPKSIGVYQPVNKKTKRAFDIPNGNKDAGIRLIQYGSTKGDHQHIVPVENEDGTYYIKFFHSDLYMTVLEDGNISQEEFVGGDTQTFKLEEVKVKEEAAVAVDESLVDSAAFNGKYVNVSADGKALNAVENVVSAEEIAATDSFIWKMVAQGKNKYAFINAESGLALSAARNVTAEAVDYGISQVFELLENENGTYAIRNNSGYINCTDGVLSVSLTNPQYFTVSAPKLDESKYSDDSISGKYIEITSVSAGKKLAVAGNAENNGAAVVASDDAEDDFATWALTSQGGGMYIITSKGSNLSFDISGNSINPGVAVTQYTTNYGYNQQYAFIPNEDGTYLIQNRNSQLYLTERSGAICQERLLKNSSDKQKFTIDITGEYDAKLLGATAMLFVLKGEDKVTNAKVQWNAVNGADKYEIYRSADNGEAELLAVSAGNTVDDYDLEIGKKYTYTVYALSDGSVVDSVSAKTVEPYELPSDLTVSSNIEESGLNRPEEPYADGKYYHYQSWGRDDGGSGFGRVMMQYSEDGVHWTDWEEVLNYKEILAHETCKDFDTVRFESNNFVYNREKNIIAYIAHLEADGGYGTAMTSIATGTPGGKMTFNGAVRPEGDDTRDLNVYVDDDWSAYVIAAVHGNADLALYKLSEDWSQIEKRVCYVNRSSWRELPSMLKVDGIYYLFTSGTAGWYPTQGMYNSAENIEGPWSPLKRVGNTSTFSSQSGTIFRLSPDSEKYYMSTYRWMYFWQDATVKRTTNRRYPVEVENGYAFYDFFDEVLYNVEKDILIPVQNGRILSQGMPANASDNAENAGAVNDGGYQTYWYADKHWPYTWEVDLGKVCSLSELQISWLIWNGSEPYYQYRLEGSVDGITYTTILDNEEGYTDYGFTVDQISGAARYLRLVVTDAVPRSGDNNYPAQLYEVKVLGK